MTLYYAPRTNLRNDDFSKEAWGVSSWAEMYSIITKSGDTSFAHNVYDEWLETVRKLKLHPFEVVKSSYENIFQWNPEPENDKLFVISVDDYDNGNDSWSEINWDYIDGLHFIPKKYGYYGYENYSDYIKYLPGKPIDDVLLGYYILYEPA